MISALKKLIRWARVTGSGGDSKQFPVQQVNFLNKNSDVIMVFPYGMHGNADKDSLALMFQVLGDNGSKAAIPTSYKDRPATDAGEVVFFHPPTGSKIHFKKSGDIELDAGAGNVTLKSSTGKISLESLQAEITSLTAKISGQTYLTHVHSTTSPGAPTGPPIPPPPSP